MIFYTSRIFHLKVLYCTVDPSSIKYSGNKTAAKMLSCSMKTLNFSSFIASYLVIQQNYLTSLLISLKKNFKLSMSSLSEIYAKDKYCIWKCIWTIFELWIFHHRKCKSEKDAMAVEVPFVSFVQNKVSWFLNSLDNFVSLSSDIPFKKIIIH